MGVSLAERGKGLPHKILNSWGLVFFFFFSHPSKDFVQNISVGFFVSPLKKAHLRNVVSLCVIL